jgi:hypothetical protein
MLKYLDHDFHLYMNTYATEKTPTIESITKSMLNSLEAKNIHTKKTKKSKVPASSSTFDMDLAQKKSALKGEMIVIVRNNVSYTFIFTAVTKDFNRFKTAFHKLVNSVSFQDFQSISAEKSYDVEGIHFVYPGTWPVPSMLQGTDSMAANMWQGKDAVWDLAIVPQCEWCGYPYLFPMFLQKFDLKYFTAEYLMKRDQAKILSDKTINNIRSIVTRGMLSGLEKDIQYYVTGDAIYRLTGDRNDIEEPDGQKMVFSSFSIQK